jgi:hypothetical protein
MTVLSAAAVYPTDQLTDSQMQWGVELGAEATGVSCHHELVIRLLEHRQWLVKTAGVLHYSDSLSE